MGISVGVVINGIDGDGFGVITVMLSAVTKGTIKKINKIIKNINY